MSGSRSTPTSCPCSDKGGRVEAFTSPCFSARGAVTPLRCQALVSYFWSLLRDSWRSVLFIFPFCLDSRVLLVAAPEAPSWGLSLA